MPLENLRKEAVLIGHNSNPHRDEHRGVFLSSVNGLATVLAIVIALIGAPFAYNVSAPYVLNLAAKTYGADMVALVDFCWFILMFPLVFFAARASVGVALLVSGSWIAYRFI